MESTDVIAQKILHLKDLVDKPDRNKGSALRLFHDLFQLTHEGRDMSPEDAEWLSETARLFLSPELLNVLFKLHLDVYGFFFAALSFVDIDDIVDDLTNGDVLKNSKSFPPGVYNKLKRELLGSATNLIRSNVQSKPAREETPVSPSEIELGRSDTEQVEVKERDVGSDFHLLCTSLIKNLSAGNKGGVMESLQKLVHHKQFSIDSFEFKDALKQSAALLLSTEVSELFEKLYLGEYSYLLAANYITDINALMDDISNVGVLKTILPAGAFRNLKREMSTKMSNKQFEFAVG